MQRGQIKVQLWPHYHVTLQHYRLFCFTVTAILILFVEFMENLPNETLHLTW